MKRLTLLFSLFMLATTALQAQQHVEQAWEALRVGSQDGATVKTECYPSNFPGECQSRHDTFKFTLPASERDVVDAMYQAFDSDRQWCTQYRRQDAFSAHNREVDIQVPSHRLQLQVDDQVNLLWGGFFNIDGTAEGHRLPADAVFAPGLTLYRYYVLTWSYDAQGNIEGRVRRLTFVADTQKPDVHPVKEPSYAPLTKAVEAFTKRTDVPMARSLSFRRASADGQWTHIYHTYGFNIPIREEQNVLLPLYEAFEQTKQRAYHFLNKPAGETAQDVQIIVNEQGGTIGLGLQQDWNIVYAYFNDEDYPRNRYVYALWYKADVPRRRIVGELFVINTLRPEGGTVAQPFIQRAVPAYLWRLPLGTMGSQNAQHSPSTLPAYEATLSPLGTLPDVRDMQRILSGQDPDDGFMSQTFLAKMRQRGVSLSALSHELDTMVQRAEEQRRAFDEELAVLQQEHRLGLHNLSNMLKVNWSSDEYARMTEEERRQRLDNIRSEYQRQAQHWNEDFVRRMKALDAKYPNMRIEFFDRDSLPSAFTRRVGESLTGAFRGDGSQTDATLAEYIRQFAELTAGLGGADYREALSQRIDSLRRKAPSSSVQNQFAEAMSALGFGSVAPNVPKETKETPKTKAHIDTKVLRNIHVESPADIPKALRHINRRLHRAARRMHRLQHRYLFIH